MKEELINKILERIEFNKEKIESLDELVLESLCLVKNNNDLRDVLMAILDYKLDPTIILEYVEAYNLNVVNVIKLIISDNNYKLAKEALNKMSLAKHDFQIEYIDKIYGSDNIECKNLIVDVILKCNNRYQASTIFDIFDLKAKKEEYFATYLELTKLIAKEKHEFIIDGYFKLIDNEDIIKLGLLLPVAKLISKCKCENQAKNMDNYLSNLDSKNAPYILKNAMYFLRTTDEDKLKSLFKYLTYSLRQNLLVDEEKVNLIIGARNKFNSDAIEGSLTFGPLIDTDLDGEAAEILNSSRKEYNAKYAKSLVNIGSVDGLSGAMIVNESETKYKAEQVHSIISIYANTDEIKRSLEFAVLINSVYTKLEIDLIYLLSQNSYLNKLGIDLPIARIIANATESEYDAIIIWECLKDEENRKNAINGFASLIKNINPKSRQKAENIINLVLMKAQNKPIHLDVVDEVVVTNEKLTNKVKKLINKKLKK